MERGRETARWGQRKEREKETEREIRTIWGGRVTTVRKRLRVMGDKGGPKMTVCSRVCGGERGRSADMIGQRGLEEVIVGLTCMRIRQHCGGASGRKQLLPRVPVTFYSQMFVCMLCGQQIKYAGYKEKVYWIVLTVNKTLEKTNKKFVQLTIIALVAKVWCIAIWFKFIYSALNCVYQNQFILGSWGNLFF